MSSHERKKIPDFVAFTCHFQPIYRFMHHSFDELDTQNTLIIPFMIPHDEKH